jgi:hypothetical protein
MNAIKYTATGEIPEEVVNKIKGQSLIALTRSSRSSFIVD